MSDLAQDLRFALRMLRRSPWFGVVVIGTLALGIGVNTALFSVVQSVLLAPLPYAEPDRVAMIWSRWEGFEKTWVSEGEFHNYRATLRSFEDLGLFQTFEVNLTEGEEPERLTATAVMPNVFAIADVPPVLGRGFREEEAVQNGPPVAVLSYELWQRRYGGDPSVLGRTISVNGEPQQVIGVMPAGFRLPLDYRADQPTQLWFPYALSAAPGPVPQNGGSHGSYAIGRLRAGVTVDAANAELRSVVGRLNAEGVYPADWRFMAFAVSAVDEVAGLLKPALMVLLGAVAFVLLIACANVANLLLVRGEDRRREVGVRAALGADRWRLVRQLLAENLVLAVVGGMVGAWVAWLGIALLRSFAPANLPRVP
ncbi:MAG: ABC transporter permease, partial [Longimicrobiales bacterium]